MLTEDKSKPGVMSAIRQVMGRMRYLQHDSKHEKQQWGYTSIDALKLELNRHMLEAGLVLLPHVVTHESRERIGKDGNAAGQFAAVRITYEWHHVETGQSIKLDSIGEGFDMMDEAIAKACTDALRNMLKSLLLFATGGRPMLDENDEPMDLDAIEATFEDHFKRLKTVEPEKGAAQEFYREVLAARKSHSKEPVRHPREFKSRADALQSLAALQQMHKSWSKQSIEDDASNVAARGPTHDSLEVTDEDISDDGGGKNG